MFFEDDTDSSSFQHLNVFKAVYCVSCESRYRFAYDVVDLASQAVIYHSLELGTFVCSCTRDAFISVYAYESPFGIVAYLFRVCGLLSFVAVKLFFGVRRYSAVGCDSLLAVLFLVDHEVFLRFNYGYRLFWGDSSNFKHCLSFL